MSITNPKIVWEKWIDPYLAEKPETELPDFLDARQDEDYSLYQEIEDGAEEAGITEHKEKTYAIASPLGIIPYNEYTASSKIFNFWIGHTNFDISDNVAFIIEKVRGVEILDIFTRYRFRIAIGKSFKDRNVMNDINQEILSHFKS